MITGWLKKMQTRLIKKFGILTPNGKLPVESLSGGNMQKVVVARELSSEPYVLIASQPTRGIDVGATEFIREQLVQEPDRRHCRIVGLCRFKRSDESF